MDQQPQRVVWRALRQLMSLQHGQPRRGVGGAGAGGLLLLRSSLWPPWLQQHNLLSPVRGLRQLQGPLQLSPPLRQLLPYNLSWLLPAQTQWPLHLNLQPQPSQHLVAKR